MLSYDALELVFKKCNPHAKCPSLFDATSQWDLDIQEIPIEATLVCKFCEQPRIMWRYGQ